MEANGDAIRAAALKEFLLRLEVHQRLRVCHGVVLGMSVLRRSGGCHLLLRGHCIQGQFARRRSPVGLETRLGGWIALVERLTGSPEANDSCVLAGRKSVPGRCKSL